MAILTSYFARESCGLLGPQMAATVIQENTDYDCIAVAVAREDDKELVKRALSEYFGAQRPVLGFSCLSGRPDLFDLARELRRSGAFAILAGPQAGVDFSGEVDWQNHAHRFSGLSDCFDMALQGPAEQAIPLLSDPQAAESRRLPGLLHVGQDGVVVRDPPKAWDARFLDKVRWDNLYAVGDEGLVPIEITLGQVLRRIGCPYAKKIRRAKIDFPSVMAHRQGQRTEVSFPGCAFCDVATDKGYCGALEMEVVLSQIECLPRRSDGKRIPFELIDENPLPGLPRLLRQANQRAMGLSQINLILRADWLLKGQEHLREALRLAREMGVFILLGSVGFESFDDTILRNLNKGLTAETNLNAVYLMRRLNAEFPDWLGYARRHGAIHGFIHPTPWDTEESARNTSAVFAEHGLPHDVIPAHSTPLIIHHASGLGDWIREVERTEGVRYERYGSIIGWWD